MRLVGWLELIWWDSAVVVLVMEEEGERGSDYGGAGNPVRCESFRLCSYRGCRLFQVLD